MQAAFKMNRWPGGRGGYSTHRRATRSGEAPWKTEEPGLFSFGVDEQCSLHAPVSSSCQARKPKWVEFLSSDDRFEESQANPACRVPPRALRLLATHSFFFFLGYNKQQPTFPHARSGYVAWLPFGASGFSRLPASLYGGHFSALPTAGMRALSCRGRSGHMSIQDPPKDLVS